MLPRWKPRRKGCRKRSMLLEQTPRARRPCPPLARDHDLVNRERLADLVERKPRTWTSWSATLGF